MNTAAALSGILGDLYAAAHDPSRFDAFLAGVGRSTQSHIVALHIQDLKYPAGSLMAAFGIDAATMSRYAEFAAENPWMARSNELVYPGAVLDGDAVLTPKELMRTRMFADYARHIDTMHTAAICGALDSNRGAFLTLCRSEQVGVYDRDTLELLELLAPHWVSALAQMREYQQLTLDLSMHKTHATAVFYLDGRGYLINSNAAGEQMLALGWLVGHKGVRLQPVTAAARLAFTQALASKLAARPLPSAGVVALRDAEGTLVAFARIYRIAPESLEGLASTKGVLAVFVQPICHRPSPEIPAVLAGLFGFTHAESRFALALYQTTDLKAAAGDVGITLATARSRLQQLLEKTGLHSQNCLLMMLDALVREI